MEINNFFLSRFFFIILAIIGQSIVTRKTGNRLKIEPLALQLCGCYHSATRAFQIITFEKEMKLFIHYFTRKSIC